MLPQADTIDIYTDGGYFEKIRVGGWSWVIYKNRTEFSRNFGSKSRTSSLEMELTAANQALEYLEAATLYDKTKPKKITVHTDCRILIEGLQTKYSNWCRNDWKVKSGKTVVFKELWQSIYNLSQQQNIEWNWVKGHSGNPGNTIADKLAREAANSFQMN